MEHTETNSSVWDKLSDRQIQAVNYKMLHPDASYGEIAKELDIPEPTIKKWRLKKIVAEIRKDTGKAITAYANRGAFDAMRKLEKLAESDDERVALAAIKELLDRAVGKATQNSTISNPDGSNLFPDASALLDALKSDDD